MINFIPLGGAEEIGASCFYLNIDGTGILLDCGIHPQKTGFESLPDFSVLVELNLDYVILSHAHQDHIGALPFLIKQYPHVKIIATPQTLEVAKLTLHNTVNILKGQILDDNFPVYTHDEVDLLLRSAVELPYNTEFSISGLRHENEKSIKVLLYNAGHIIGSAAVLLDYGRERIFYTGDIKISPQTLLSGATLPKDRITTLITESTYGGTDPSVTGDLDSQINRFVNESNKIFTKGGSILIPVFALGKMQEVLAIIFTRMLSGVLTQVPVYTGGIGNKISHIYDLNKFKVNYRDKNLSLNDFDAENYFEINDLNKFRKNPSFIVASSGMILPRTSSHTFAEFWLRQKDFAIFTVGYMDPKTPGYLISTSQKGDKIVFNGIDEFEIHCEINKFFFPTHSNRQELLTIVEKLIPDKIILVHGEENSKNWVGSKILELIPNSKVYSAEKLKRIDL